MVSPAASQKILPRPPRRRCRRGVLGTACAARTPPPAAAAAVPGLGAPGGEPERRAPGRGRPVQQELGRQGADRVHRQRRLHRQAARLDGQPQQAGRVLQLGRRQHPHLRARRPAGRPHPVLRQGPGVEGQLPPVGPRRRARSTASTTASPPAACSRSSCSTTRRSSPTYGVQPPTTWTELMAVVDRVKVERHHPVRAGGRRLVDRAGVARVPGRPDRRRRGVRTASPPARRTRGATRRSPSPST